MALFEGFTVWGLVDIPLQFELTPSGSRVAANN